jgi:hypothetical protein
LDCRGRGTVRRVAARVAGMAPGGFCGAFGCELQGCEPPWMQVRVNEGSIAVVIWGLG